MAYYQSNQSVSDKLNPTTDNSIYVANPELNPQLVANRTAVGETLPTQSSPATINAGILGNTASLAFPPTPQPSNDALIALSSLSTPPSLDQIQNTINAPTATEQNQQQTKGRLATLYQQLTGKGASQQQAEQQAKVPVYQGQVTDLTNQINALTNEARAVPLQVQQQFAGTGATAGGVEPIQTARLRDNAVKSLSLSSALSAAQNNLALAQQQADRAVELKYQPIQAGIDYLKQLYSMNQDTLAREDSKRAANLNLLIQERQRVLDESKDNDKAVLAIVSEAAKNGTAPAAVLNQAIGSGTPSKALALLSPYFSDPMKQKQYELEIKKFELQRDYQKAQIANLTAEAAKKYADIKEAGSTGSISPYQRERSIRNLQSIEELKKRVSGLTTGIGSLLSIIPGTESRDFSADLETLKSNIAFGELTAMREASKTGGALGQISDREGQLLQSALGALDAGQSRENFNRNLQKIEDSINRWYTAIGENPPVVPLSSGSGTIFTAPDGTLVQIID